MLHLKELEDDEVEPTYTCFGNDATLDLAAAPDDTGGEYKFNCRCEQCEGQDQCDEYAYGPYCVAVAKQYYAENKNFATVKNAYKVFVAHYNRAVDFHSFEGLDHKGTIRTTEIIRPPYYMKEGSLKFALHWVKWQIENGPLKGHYIEQRRERRRKRRAVEAEREAKSVYRYIENAGGI